MQLWVHIYSCRLNARALSHSHPEVKSERRGFKKKQNIEDLGLLRVQMLSDLKTQGHSCGPLEALSVEFPSGRPNEGYEAPHVIDIVCPWNIVNGQGPELSK